MKNDKVGRFLGHSVVSRIVDLWIIWAILTRDEIFAT